MRALLLRNLLSRSKLLSNPDLTALELGFITRGLLHVHPLHNRNTKVSVTFVFFENSTVPPPPPHFFLSSFVHFLMYYVPHKLSDRTFKMSCLLLCLGYAFVGVGLFTFRCVAVLFST